MGALYARHAVAVVPRAQVTFETLVELVGHRETAMGLRVQAKLDKRC